jgi:hypothetical protein
MTEVATQAWRSAQQRDQGELGWPARAPTPTNPRAPTPTYPRATQPTLLAVEEGQLCVQTVRTIRWIRDADIPNVNQSDDRR